MHWLDRYLLREIAIPSGMALTIVSFFAIGNEIRQQIEEVIAFVRIGDVLQLAVLFFPLLVSYVIPITYLLGILMAFSRLAKQGEITAIRAGGISLKRAIAPVIVVGALLSAGCFLTQDIVQPWAIKKAFALVFTELPQRATLDVLPAGIMHEYEGWRVYFERKDADSGALYNIDLVRPEEEHGSTVFYAASARLVPEEGDYKLLLTDGHLVTPENMRLGFESQVLTIPGPSTTKSAQVRKAKDLSELFASQAELEREYRKRPTNRSKRLLVKERNEIARRLSLPFAAIAFACVAAPLGARATRGGRSYAFVMGFGIVLMYAVFQIAVAPQSLAPLGEVVMRAWIPNALLTAVGVGLIWRVDRVS